MLRYSLSYQFQQNQSKYLLHAAQGLVQMNCFCFIFGVVSFSLLLNNYLGVNSSELGEFQIN